jgi:hypothetical protein
MVFLWTIVKVKTVLSPASGWSSVHAFHHVPAVTSAQSVRMCRPSRYPSLTEVWLSANNNNRLDQCG